jgi:hypothetical protein
MAFRGSIANMVTAATMIRLASAHEIHLMAMGAFPVRGRQERTTVSQPSSAWGRAAAGDERHSTRVNVHRVMTTARWLPHGLVTAWSPGENGGWRDMVAE